MSWNYGDEETGVQKVVRRIISLAVAITVCGLLYFLITRISHWVGGVSINLPDLSNHDFEWIIIFLLGAILFETGCKCKCGK